jgi:anti-anti-sigma regulatory factor
MAVALPPPVIRITTDNSNGLRLIVEGQLSGPAVEELRKSCARSRGREVVVDVSGVVFADSLAASLLKELIAAGFVIQGCSDFINELLR